MGKTSRGTWQSAERAIAKFHNPVDGRRTPLSGINSGHTHADCIGVEGMFIEVKYRQRFALWGLYESTRVLARKEGKLPLVSIREKGKKGFIDMIHSDYLDAYVQMYIRNRCIVVESTDNVMVGETVLTKFYSGPPSQIRFLISHLTHLSFNAFGNLRDKWWDRGGEKLTIQMQLLVGFENTLYGAFNMPMKVTPHIGSEEVIRAIQEVAG